MRAKKIAGAALAAIILILVLVVMVGIPAGFMTSAIQARIQRETGYRLTVAGASRIGLWPRLNVTLNELTLSDPNDRDADRRLTIERVQADMSLSSAWSGHPDISELVITRPVLHLPLLRERLPGPTPAPKAATSPAPAPVAPAIGHTSIKDGAIVFSNARDKVENRIKGIDAEAVAGPDRQVKFSGTARAGAAPLTFDIRASAPLDHPNVPFELTLDAPGLLQGRITAKAEARLSGSTVMINGVSGTLGDGAFNGWASVDIASKPLVKLDLDFRKLDFAGSKASDGSAAQAWSDTPVSLTGLNYVDAELRLSANALALGDAQFTQAAISSQLANGVMKTRIENLGAYGGQISGEVTLDVTGGTPTFAAQSDIAGVRALPLLQNLADFEHLDGKLQAKLALRSAGNSQRQIMSSLSGTAVVDFRDGAIRGLNVAKMIRSLTAGTLSGWQESPDQSTDLTELSASFRVDKGQATTSDLNLVGPLVRVTGGGTIDLGRKTLALRVEPKLVMTTEGQGRSSEPVGLGIPVAIDGAWAEPRIYPDIAGILDNPEAAYAKLREMGKGLFGEGGAGFGGLLNGLGLGGDSGKSGGSSGDRSDTSPPSGTLGEAIGKLIQEGIQQGLGGGRGNSAPDAPPSPHPQNDAAPQQRDSQPMNDVLRFFNR